MSEQPRRRRSAVLPQEPAQPLQPVESEDFRDETHAFSAADQTQLNYYSTVFTSPKTDFAPQVIPETVSGEGDNAGKIYRRRGVDSFETEEREDYQAFSGDQKKSGGIGRRLLWLLPVLILVGVVMVLLLKWPEETQEQPEESAPAQTQVPVVVYDPGTEHAFSETALENVAALAGEVPMEPVVSDDESLILKTPLGDGLSDFYLFSADQGKLLCYFERLREEEAFLQKDGNPYFAQSPYVVLSDGSPLIEEDFLKENYGEKAVLHPFYGDWAVVDNGSEETFVSRTGEQFSNLRYCKLYPFTGKYTLGYVDSGSAGEQRYSLHLLGEDGSWKLWFTAGDTGDVLLCCLDYAFLKNGDVYRLPDLSQPVFHSEDIRVYPDFETVVYRVEETGTYTLLIGGESYYEPVYTAISPVSGGDLSWKAVSFGGENVSLELCGIAPASQGKALSYSFQLEKTDGQEYISLSVTHTYPLLRDFELEAIR